MKLWPAQDEVEWARAFGQLCVVLTKKHIYTGTNPKFILYTQKIGHVQNQSIV